LRSDHDARTDSDILNKLKSNPTLTHAQAKLGVIVQRMIPAYASGVGFNIDPASNEPGICIEANYGLGKSIVDGEATPDHWLLDARGMRINEREMGSKLSKRSIGEVGQIESVFTERHERNKYVLTDEQVLNIAKMIKRIAKQFKSKHGNQNIDTEFAVDQQGKVYFVQIRPETVWSGKQSMDVSGIQISEAQKAAILFAGGMRGFAGAVSGTLRYVKSLEDGIARIRQGDILVTYATDPSWNTVMSKINGILIDEGGMTSHAAIVSREYGIPSIVAAGNATESLRKYDGTIVTLDANNRIIYEGFLPVIHGNISGFIRTDSVRKGIFKSGHSHHLEDEEGQWVGKPEYPLAGWQLELYLKAFEVMEHIFSYPIVRKVQDGVPYI
jgi:pyruvate,water dikinase